MGSMDRGWAVLGCLFTLFLGGGSVGIEMSFPVCFDAPRQWPARWASTSTCELEGKSCQVSEHACRLQRRVDHVHRLTSGGQRLRKDQMHAGIPKANQYSTTQAAIQVNAWLWRLVGGAAAQPANNM